MPCFPMRTLLVLCTAFGLLAAYFELNLPRTPLSTKNTTARVIRDVPLQKDMQNPTRSASTTQIETSQEQRTPLNLQLPAVTSIQQVLQAGETSFKNLFKYQDNEKVTYNAELVYDRKTGEDITGGKLNIKIPLT